MRGLLGELPRQDGEVVLLDMEASIEHMSRGTPRHVDLMLVVTEPYYRSLESAGRLVPLAKELGIPRVFAVANKVRNPRDAATIQEYCDHHGIEVAVSVPFDQGVGDADLHGQALLDVQPDAPAVAAIRRLSRIVRGGTSSTAQ
ncbi:MAG: ATP-binding protein [Dehalococcoidia bacterium]